MLRKQFTERHADRKLPGFANTMFTILVPVILMLLATLADIILPEDSMWYQMFKYIGDPITALLIATVYSFFSLGFIQGMSRDRVLSFSNDCLGPIASILLVIGAGGAFNNVLIDSGVGDYIADLAKHSPISPILLSWLILCGYSCGNRICYSIHDDSGRNCSPNRRIHAGCEQRAACFSNRSGFTDFVSCQ